MREYNQVSGFNPLFSAVTAMVSPAHQAITQQPLYEQVKPLGFNPGLKTFALGAFDKIVRWNRRASERHALAALDDRMLEDLGIERTHALDEAAKPFWRA